MIDALQKHCNKDYIPTRHKKQLATAVIRQAIKSSGLSFIELERRSGVTRQSIMKFARGEQSLRLDMVDRLMDCLGLGLVKKAMER